MKRGYIFILRAILSGVFSVILSRIFFRNANIMYVILLAVFIIVAAYFSEYLRKKK